MSKIKLYSVAGCYTENIRGAEGQIEDVLLFPMKQDAVKYVQDLLDSENKDSFYKYRIEKVNFHDTPDSPEGKIIAKAEYCNIRYETGGDYVWEIREYEIDI